MRGVCESTDVLCSLQWFYMPVYVLRIMELFCPCGNGHLIKNVTRNGSNVGRAYFKCPGSVKASVGMTIVYFFFFLIIYILNAYYFIGS